MAYLAITDPEIANGAIITQTLMHKNRDNLQAICDDDVTIPPANTLKRMGRQNAIIIGATDPGGSELLRVGGGIRAPYLVAAAASALILLNSSTASDPTTSAYISLQRNGVEKGWAGYGLGANSEFGINNTIGIVKIYSTTVIGTDPSGSELLRVGGGIRANGNIGLGIAPGSGGGGLANWLVAEGSSYSGGLQCSVLGSPKGYCYYDAAVTAMTLQSGPGTDLALTTSGAQRLRISSATGAIVIGTDPGGSELLRVGGGIRAANGVIVGQRTGAIDVRVDGGDSGVNSGGRFSVWNAASSIIQIGNSSAILGGAYSATPMLHANVHVNVPNGLIIGTDPGGSELLRVGGAIRSASLTTTGDISIKVPMTWPAANATGFLQNNGSGGLVWNNVAPGAANVTKRYSSGLKLIQNTTVETSMLGGTPVNGSATILGGTLVSGSIVRIRICGAIRTLDNTQTGRFLSKINGVTFATTALSTITSSVETQFVLESTFIVNNISDIGNSAIMSGGKAVLFQMGGALSGAFDPAVSNTFDISFIWNLADSANYVQPRIVSIITEI